MPKLKELLESIVSEICVEADDEIEIGRLRVGTPAMTELTELRVLEARVEAVVTGT